MAIYRERADRFIRHLEPLQAALEAYCRRLLHDGGSLADVLQSAVAKAFRDFDLYAEGSNFRAWIFRYVHYEIQNLNRKIERDRHEDLPPHLSVDEVWQMAVDEPLLQALLDKPERILEQCDEALAETLHALPALERAVLLLHAIGEFKYREIADILQVPIGTVMSSLSRCRLRIRQRLIEVERSLGRSTPQEKRP